MQQFYGPIRTGVFASPRTRFVSSLVLTGVTVAATVFGGFRAGLGGALSGLIVAGLVAHSIGFLLGSDRTPIASAGTSHGRFQRFASAGFLLMVVFSAILGGWRWAWIWALGGAALFATVLKAGLLIWATRRVRLGFSPAIESKLAQLHEARTREGTAPTPEEDAALEELFDACEAEFLTACVLAKHEATRPLLRKVYFELLANGGGIRIQEYFLPGAAFGTSGTLDFLLATHGLSGTAVVELLEAFFRGKVVGFPMGGPSDDDLLVPGASLGGAPPAIIQRLSEIAQRLSATHPKGLLKEPAISLELEHNDLDRAQEDLVRALKDGIAARALNPGSRRGESRPLSHAVALGQLIDLAHDHPPTARVIHRYGATRERLAKLFEELHDHGGNRWEGDGYIAASALLHPETLGFLLAEKPTNNSYERTRQVARFLQGFPLTSRRWRDSSPRPVDSGPLGVKDGVQRIAKVSQLLQSGEAETVIAMLEPSVGSSEADSNDDELYYLGMAYLQVGRFDAAEAVLASAVASARYLMHMAKSAPSAAHRKLLGAGGLNRFSLVRNLHGLGIARLASADYSGAQDALREALEQALILHLTPDLYAQLRQQLNALIVDLFERLGEVHQARGEPLKAQVMYGCSFRRRRAFYGPQHPETGKSLHKLGVVALELGQHAKGKALLDEAEALFRAKGLTNHPDYARIVFAQSRAHLDAGEYVEADRHYSGLLDGGMLYAQDALLVADALARWAMAFAAVDAPEHGLERLQKALEILDHSGNEILQASSELRSAAYLATCRDHVDIYATLSVALVARRHERANEAVRGLFSLALRYKGIGAEIVIARQRFVRATTDPRLAECLRELASLRAEVATLELRRSRTGEAPTSLRLLQLARQREQLEQELARGAREAAPTGRNSVNDAGAVAAALPAGHTLIEYLRYDEYDSKALVARGEPRWKAPRYLAFVLYSGQPESLRLIDLGEATAIDDLIGAFRFELTSDIEDYEAGSGPEADSWFIEHPSIMEIGRRLRAAVLDPLSLEGHAALLIAPDSTLATLPFGALPDAAGKPLLLEQQIAYLGVARDLLRSNATVDAREAADSERPHVSRSSAVVAAAPDFWLGCSRAPVEENEGDGNRFFEPLDGTRKEAEAIADMLGIRPVLGGSFTKSVLETCASPVILHVATHGYYLPAQPGGEQTRRGWSWPRDDAEAPRLSDFMPGLENPMLRSGLVTCGANAWLRGDQLPHDVGDGLITAEEVADMDLQHTELTVLSACDTGLGDIVAGEGVLGLRRAFTLAGSRTLVTSLWKVGDQVTRELMEDFYANLLRGMGRADALREAQLSFRTRYPNPRDWAAFISQGELGPIESLVARHRLRERTTEIEPALTGAIDAPVLDRAGDITRQLAEDGDFSGAIRLQRRVAAALTGSRGELDPATLEATGWLVALLRFAGELAEARPICEAHLIACEKVHGAEHEATNEAREQLALVLGELGERERTCALREDALRYFRQRKGDDDVDTLRAEANLAEAIKEAGDVETSYQLQCRVLERLRNTLGEEDTLCLTIMSNISLCALDLGNVHEARDLQERCLSARRKILGERDADTIMSMSILAMIRARLGDREGALDLAETVLVWRRLVLGENHLHTLMATHNLAVSLAAVGDSAQALDLERKVAEQSRFAFGDDHDLTLSAKERLATMLEERDACSDEVSKLRREIHEHTRAAHGDDDVRTLTAAAALAESLEATGDLLGATELLQTTLEQRRRATPQDVRAIAGLMSHLANLWHSRKEDGRAVETGREAVALCRSAFGEDDATTLASNHNLAGLLLNAGLIPEARQAAQEVFDVRQRLLGENDPDTLDTMTILAAALQSSGEPEAAATILYRLVPLALRSLGERSSATMTALHVIGRNLIKRKLYPEAREMLEEGSAICARVLGSEHEKTLREKYHLGIALAGCGEPLVARETWQAIADVRARTLGPDHPDTLSIEELLRDIHPEPV